MRFDGKKVLVVGAGTGIGKGVALEFGRAGADVVLTYTSSAKGAEEVVAELTGLGRTAHAIQADMSRYLECGRVVAEAVEKLGGLDVLVYNSGITDPHSYLEITEAEYDRTLDINLKGAFFTSQAAAKSMVEHGVEGAIVVMGSVQGILSLEEHAHYAASKGGITMFVKTAAIELGRYGIRINAVAPGMIEVERYEKFMRDWDSESYGATVPLGRVGYPSDIAHAAMYLASDYASYVTGALLVVDGAMTARLDHHLPSPDTMHPNLRPKKQG